VLYCIVNICFIYQTKGFLPIHLIVLLLEFKQMTRKTYQFIHFTSYLTILHGIVYFIVKDFMQVETDYGPRPHYFQTYIQGAHIVLSPLLLISFGILWQEHILKFFQKRSRKLISGVTLTFSLVLIGFSGYLIQILYTDAPKKFAVWLHLLFSALYILAYLRHHFLSFKK